MAGKYHGARIESAMVALASRPGRGRMKHAAVLATLVAALTLGHAAPARADVTAFWGFAPKPSTHSARGFSLGISMLVVGFEGEYATLAENASKGAPGLRTGMINGMIQTPTSTQMYVTVGGGLYQETLGTAQETHFATNFGGGIKISLAGPVRLRIDYRVFNLRGSALYRNPQRIYAGINLRF